MADTALRLPAEARTTPSPTAELLYSARWQLATAGTVVALLIVWELAVRALSIPIYILPAPSAVIVSLGDGLATGTILVHGWVTLQEVLGGFAVGSVAALVLAFLITRWEACERILYPIIIGLQSVPKVALAPLILTWFGFGLTSKLVTTALLAFFPLLVNIVVGIQSTDRDRLDMFTALGATEWKKFRMVKLPTALPYVFAGLDIAVVFSVIGAIVAEFVGAQAGLGYLIQQSNTNLDAATTFAVLVVLSLMGVVLHWIVTGIGRRVVFWQGAGLKAISGE